VRIRRSHFAVPVALAALLVAGCGEAATSDGPKPRTKAAVPASAPVVRLSPQDRAVWRTPRRRNGGIPVLLYHGVDERSGFVNQADAFYGVAPVNFAKQLALLHHAGYTAITLEQFSRFHAGEPVDLPAHPILITFDDARVDSWVNADGVLARYGWSAVMFVDVGAVTRRDPEYATWGELAAMQRSGRWSLQLHAGRGHHSIRYGAGARDVGPFYAYRDAVHGETLSGWHRRVTADLAWGERELRSHVPGYRQLAFAPPFGAYGQLGTNDPEIPRLLSRDLRAHFGLVFVQQRPHAARPRDPIVTRLQLDRTVTGGALHYWLASA
jgi:peptidoglycan/xylan/chitin deacetylase (PgdA/CDA1 family)